MHLDLDALIWPGRHQPVFAANGMVATSQPLAARVGLDVLRDGGNAVDAAFALVWDGERLHGLNGSGRAPAGLSAAVVRGQGYDAMPERGWLTVTVPGVPAAWQDLHARFGKLPFARLLEPVRNYADRHRCQDGRYASFHRLASRSDPQAICIGQCETAWWTARLSMRTKADVAGTPKCAATARVAAVSISTPA